MDLELNLDPKLTPHTYTQKFYAQFIVWLVMAEVRCSSAYFLLLSTGLKKYIIDRLKSSGGSWSRVDSPQNWPHFGTHIVINTLDGSSCKNV